MKQLSEFVFAKSNFLRSNDKQRWYFFILMFYRILDYSILKQYFLSYTFGRNFLHKSLTYYFL